MKAKVREQKSEGRGQKATSYRLKALGKVVLIVVVAMFLIGLNNQIVLAGNIDSPAEVSEAGSRMYTLQDIYNRITAGTDATKGTGFSEPAASPGSTGKSLDDIYSEIPGALSNPAVAAEVNNGEEFITRSGGQMSKVTGTRVSDYGCPKTGQTTSYPNGDDTDRDDGYYEKGYPTSGDHYTDNGDDTITDNATGLIWAKDGNLIKTWDDAYDPDFDQDDTHGDGKVTWQHALDFVAGMNAGTYTNFGYTDWRLPNVKELQSIINYGNWSPAIGEATVGGSGTGAPFTNTQSDYYWSSTTHAYNTTYAWYVVFRNGYVGINVKSTNYYYVRPVRAGL